ncbi:MAG: serine/threonine-protein kinase [Cyanobacteria bacterium J06633_2]
MELDFFKSIWPGPSKALGGRYQIIKRLAAGGFGQTFIAQDLHLPGQPVCVIKQLKPQVKTSKDFHIAQRLFETEAQVLYKLGNHPQIPQLLAHFTQNQEFYLAQEYIDGQPLSDELYVGDPWDETRVVALLEDILSTLAFVHRNRVIHRDLKPSNLMRRREDGRIVLIDFGAVKQAGTQIALSETSAHTIAIGTQGYMPNEQIAGMPQFSSDIYAVGMIGIQALTGQNPRVLIPDAQTGEIDWQSYAFEPNPELIELLDRMVQYDFRSRYATASEALSALQALPDELKQDITSPHHIHDDVVADIDPNHVNPSRSDEAQPPSPRPQQFALPKKGPTRPTRAIPGVAPVPPPSNESEFSDNKEFSRETLSAGDIVRSRTQHSDQPASSSNRLPETIINPIHFLGSNNPLVTTGAIAGILVIGLITWRSVAPTTVGEPVDGTSASIEQPTNVAADSVNGVNSDSSSPQSSALEKHLQQAKQLQGTEQYEQAIAQYDAAIAQDPNSAEAHQGRCYSLNQLQQYQAAITACDQALSIDPNNVRALWSKGYALDLQEQVNEAMVLYDQALAIDPNFAEAWNNKGAAQLKSGNLSAALQSLDRAIELKSDLPEAWVTRGVVLWESGRQSEAVASADRALELAPDSPDAISLRQQMRSRGF